MTLPTGRTFADIFGSPPEMLRPTIPTHVVLDDANNVIGRCRSLEAARTYAASTATEKVNKSLDGGAESAKITLRIAAVAKENDLAVVQLYPWSAKTTVVRPFANVVVGGTRKVHSYTLPA